MSKVRIVTDSSAFLLPDILEKYDIAVIPHRIKVGGAIYEEEGGFSADDLFAKQQALQTNDINKLPKVLPADINTILDIYQDLGRETEQIMSIHMSSQLSGMWAEARRAAEMMKGRYTIRVIDSMSASYGQGLLVQMAAEAAEEGANVHEIARIVNGAVPHLYASFFAESLNYLERCTRISPSQSLLGSLLGIKAMLMMEEGHLIPLEKVQTREDVVEKLVDFVAEFATVEGLGVIQHQYEASAASLVERLEEVLPGLPIETIAYPPSLACHLGPDLLGVMVYEGTY